LVEGTFVEALRNSLLQLSTNDLLAKMGGQSNLLRHLHVRSEEVHVRSKDLHVTFVALHVPSEDLLVPF